MNQYEVEVRALIENQNKSDVRNSILGSGAIAKAIVQIHDVYFCDKSCKTIEDAEMNKVGSYSIRIRKEVKGETTKITFNKKTITTENDHNSWKEDEETREDFEIAKQEMIDLGYKFFFELDKTREKFTLENMEICLEDIKDFGLGIEVEIMTTEEDSESSKNKIKMFLHSIGVRDEDIVPKSITNIIMHQRAFRLE